MIHSEFASTTNINETIEENELEKRREKMHFYLSEYSVKEIATTWNAIRKIDG